MQKYLIISKSLIPGRSSLVRIVVFRVNRSFFRSVDRFFGVIKHAIKSINCYFVIIKVFFIWLTILFWTLYMVWWTKKHNFVVFTPTIQCLILSRLFFRATVKPSELFKKWSKFFKENFNKKGILDLKN